MDKKKEYYEKFKDPRWQKKRLEVFKRDDFACQCCDEKEKTIHIHHLYYSEIFKEPWDYPNSALVTLCEDCHEYEKTYWNPAANYVSQSIRVARFFNKDIKKIADGFHRYSKRNLKTTSNINAEVVAFFLSNERAYNVVERRYFKSIKND